LDAPVRSPWSSPFELKPEFDALGARLQESLGSLKAELRSIVREELQLTRLRPAAAVPTTAASVSLSPYPSPRPSPRHKNKRLSPARCPATGSDNGYSRLLREESTAGDDSGDCLSEEEKRRPQSESSQTLELTDPGDNDDDLTLEWAKRGVFVNRAHVIADKFGAVLEAGGRVVRINETRPDGGRCAVRPQNLKRAYIGIPGTGEYDGNHGRAIHEAANSVFFEDEIYAHTEVNELLFELAQNLQSLVMMTIMLNCIAIGIETHLLTTTGHVPFVLKLAEHMFCLLYVCELVIRLLLYRWRFFLEPWNTFDFIIVGAQVMEMIEQSIGNLPYVMDVSFLRSFRIIRIIRVTRAVQHSWPESLHFVEDLRTIVFAMLGSFQSFAWSMLIIVIFVCSISVMFTSWVTTALNNSDAENNPHAEKLHYFYGSLERTALTLFESIAGGLSWDDAADPLIRGISPMAGIVYCVYVSFSTFAVLNVFCGIFVEKAASRAAEDKEEFLEKHLAKVFVDTDKDGSGQVDWDEFKSVLDKKALRDYFKALDVDISEAKGVFQLLDGDASGSIDGVEFVSGCMRMQGPAKALEVKLLLRLTSRLQEHIDVMFKKLQKDVLTNHRMLIEVLSNTSPTTTAKRERVTTA